MEINSVEQIIRECKANTKIVYSNKGGFFSPKLKSINHLEVGYSKMVSNPFTILLEFLYEKYKSVRDRLSAFFKRLFPRNPQIVGSRKDSYLTGRLSFKSKNPVRKPIAHMKVSFWARSKFFSWRKLAEGYTDDDGKFKLEFDLRAAVQSSNRKNLLFEVEEIDSINFDQERKGTKIFKIFHKQKIPKSDLIGMGYNLRDIQLDYWNYRQDSVIPRTLLEFENGDKIQDYSKGRKDALFEQLIPIELTKRKHLKKLEKNSSEISIDSIQADYPENLTQCIERRLREEKMLPGYTRGDEWFGERMMNGMNCGAFMEDPLEKGVYVIKYFGVCNYEHNEKYALPDVIICFRLNEKGIPIPFKITLRGKLSSFDKSIWNLRDITPSDGEVQWLAAKRLARCVGNVCTEIDEHFVGTHLNVEQYAIASYRNFKFSPLSILMLPHMREVSLINNGADKLIIKGFLPEGTALTRQGVIERSKDLLGMFDWKGWEPMKVVSKDHRYAQAENLFWEVVSNYVEAFFKENLTEIIEHWLEVFHFSNDLVEHSVPLFLSNVDLEKLDLNNRAQAFERFDYYKFQYGLDNSFERELINGEKKVVSRITSKEKITANDIDDIENLKKACKYAIMQATFMHTWINEHQYDDLGEVMYSTGGLRFGNKPEGVLVPESDLEIAPDLEVATKQIWFANFLSRTEYGFITKNEDGDVNPIFSDLLKAKEKYFEEIGVSIDDIESRTNI